jgi:WD40 repeat protein
VTSLAALTLADGRCLVASGSWDQTIRLWDPTTGGAVGAPLEGHIGSVTSLAALTLADGHCLVASGGKDQTIRLWEPATGRAVGAPLTGHTRGVWSLVAPTLADGRCLLASGSSDQTVRLWDVQDRGTLHVWGMGFPIRALAWTSDRLVVAGDAGLVSIETV